MSLGPDPVAKAKRRILPESTPAIRIHGRLYFVPAGDFAGNYEENTLLLFDRKKTHCDAVLSYTYQVKVYKLKHEVKLDMGPTNNLF